MEDKQRSFTKTKVPRWRDFKILFHWAMASTRISCRFTWHTPGPDTSFSRKINRYGRIPDYCV